MLRVGLQKVGQSAAASSVNISHARARTQAPEVTCLFIVLIPFYTEAQDKNKYTIKKHVTV